MAPNTAQYAFVLISSAIEGPTFMACNTPNCFPSCVLVN